MYTSWYCALCDNTYARDEKFVQNENTCVFNQNNTVRSVDGKHCWLLNENIDFCVGYNKYVIVCSTNLGILL